MYPLLDRLVSRVADRALFDTGSLVTESEALELAHLPAEETLDMLTVASLVRAIYHADTTFTCGISNAKSGRCPENCRFCAQSAHYHTEAPVYPLQDTATLVHRAEALAEAGAVRFGIVTSGTAVVGEDLDRLCEAVTTIVSQVGIAVCGSLGQLTPERAARLREAGMSGYHHNLETAASYFPHICTTHAYEDDLETVRIAREAGFRVCSGGILGLGENWSQRVELALTLGDLNVHSIPLNFLNPIAGTPLENAPLLSPQEALRCIALFRFLHPQRDILVCGGRERILGDWQSWLLGAGANGMMIGNYLTTAGNAFAADQDMLTTLGLRSRHV